ncbi:ABC transporter permease [Brevibacillus reuszeri]|uniref:ABC transporter permease n=1 Tax=Brevibacillus reuszeri TaxID=54915 RepID=UPI000CCC0AF6|nr:iron ABC transporter permease [Brevibacillus reuszeri]
MASVETAQGAPEQLLEPERKRSRFARFLSAFFEGKNAIYTLVLIVVGFLVFYPMILLFINSFQVGQMGQETTWGLENWRIALSAPDLLAALSNTINLTLVRQIISLVIGVLLAWLIARTDMPGRNWMEFGFWIVFLMPTLPMTQAWILLMDPDRGVLNQLFASIPLLGWIKFDIFSWWGIIWVHLMTGTIAVKVMLLTPAFRNMDSSLEEASRVHGASNFTTLVRIVAPVMAPAILVVTVLGIIRSLEAFEVELILGAPTNLEVFSTKIYRLIIQNDPQYGAATALGSVVLLIMLPLILFQQWVTQKGNHATVSGKFKSQPYALGFWRWPAFVIVLILVLTMSVVPLIFLLIGTFMKLYGFFNIAEVWTLDHWRIVMERPDLIQSLSNTLIICFATAILSMLLFSIVAYVIVRTQYRPRGILDFTVWLPSTLPGIVVGLGMLWLFLGFPLFKPLYGTIFVLIISTVLVSITTGTQVLKTNLTQLGSELEEASWVHGASWWYTYRRIVLPLIAPAMVVVGVFGFAIAARATSHVVLLATSDTRPISVLQLSYMSDGSYEAASVIGVIILFLTVGVALVARLFGVKVGLGRNG